MKGISLLTAALLAAGCSGLMGSLKDHQADHKGLSTLCFSGFAFPYGKVTLTHIHVTDPATGTASIKEKCVTEVKP